MGTIENEMPEEIEVPAERFTVLEQGPPEEWNYQASVSKMKPLVYKWKNLTVEMLSELFRARLNLSRTGRPESGSNEPIKTWTGYCQEIGLARSTVNRWLQYFDPEYRKLIEEPPVEYDEDYKAFIRAKLELIQEGRADEIGPYELMTLISMYAELKRKYQELFNDLSSKPLKKIPHEIMEAMKKTQEPPCSLLQWVHVELEQASYMLHFLKGRFSALSKAGEVLS